mmetsp:Transcript_83654/g.270684  ORF Transcript_83654/g.270684 Transcript_83654/m.270684 type:complete len:245 (+) Transcript_83654:905-1639(+)
MPLLRPLRVRHRRDRVLEDAAEARRSRAARAAHAVQHRRADQGRLLRLGQIRPQAGGLAEPPNAGALEQGHDLGARIGEALRGALPLREPCFHPAPDAADLRRQSRGGRSQGLPQRRLASGRPQRVPACRRRPRLARGLLCKAGRPGVHRWLLPRRVPRAGRRRERRRGGPVPHELPAAAGAGADERLRHTHGVHSALPPDPHRPHEARGAAGDGQGESRAEGGGRRALLVHSVPGEVLRAGAL